MPLLGPATFPVRFPHPDEPGDDGRHVEGRLCRSRGGHRLNGRSRWRALLMVFLFSDVGRNDAPMRVLVWLSPGIGPLPVPYGDAGAEFLPFSAAAERPTRDRPVMTATGAAGDGCLCHPFLVHTGRRHQGTRPRFPAWPPLGPRDWSTWSSRRRPPNGRRDTE